MRCKRWITVSCKDEGKERDSSGLQLLLPMQQRLPVLSEAGDGALREKRTREEECNFRYKTSFCLLFSPSASLASAFVSLDSARHLPLLTTSLAHHLSLSASPTSQVDGREEGTLRGAQRSHDRLVLRHLFPPLVSCLPRLPPPQLPLVIACRRRRIARDDAGGERGMPARLSISVSFISQQVQGGTTTASLHHLDPSRILILISF